MTVSETGEVTLTGNLDFEANSTLVMTLEVSDGTNTTTEEITINVINDDEPATIAATLSATSFAENSAVGASIASINATDPEGSAVTYTLSQAPAVITLALIPAGILPLPVLWIMKLQPHMN